MSINGINIIMSIHHYSCFKMLLFMIFFNKQHFKVKYKLIF